MPLPSAATFTQTKWLAFFAELTAKLTHHNALVTMEGAELLKRLLISRVSIAAILQQGELLLRLLDVWRGCILSGHPCNVSRESQWPSPRTSITPPPPSVAVTLNDELSFVLAELISQCIDLMVSLDADGDAYYSLLVLARAGPMLEVLLDVVNAAPPQLYGIVASLLQQLLALPLGRRVIADEEAFQTRGEGLVGFDRAAIAQLQRSVALQRHIRSLVEAVEEQGALLQHATDVLAGLLAGQQGPRRLAAVYLFNLASKRLRKHQLRCNQAPLVAPSTTAHTTSSRTHETAESTVESSELNVTITGAVPLRRTLSSPSPEVAPTNALDDLERGLRAQTRRHNLLADKEIAKRPATSSHQVGRASDGSESPPPIDPTSHIDSTSAEEPRHDVSAMVDAEPVQLDCEVPPNMAEESFRHLAAARSHDAFFDALDWVWCLTVADAAAIGTALTPSVLRDGLRRYLTAAPRTRRDRIVFTLLLLWIGNIHSIGVLRADTHLSLQELAATSLLPMLRAELTPKSEMDGTERYSGASQREGLRDATSSSLDLSAITPTATLMGGTSAATVLSTTTTTTQAAMAGDPDMATGMPVFRIPYRLSSFSRCGGGHSQEAVTCDEAGATLLPHSATRKAQEVAVLMRPSVRVILLSFVLTIQAGGGAEGQRAWVTKGRVLDVAQLAIRCARGLHNPLLDSPSTIDGTLSDEVYLDDALRSGRSDATTVAVLGCRLVAALVSSALRWGVMEHEEILGMCQPAGVPSSSALKEDETAVQAELMFGTQTLLPLLAEVAISNPDVMAAQAGGAASPVHHLPVNLRCTRYTSIGECALVALDACLQLHAQTGHLHSRGDTPTGGSSFAIEDLVRVLPNITRVSQKSVHPPVRAVPYRLLLYVSHCIDEVLLVLRHMPSLAIAAVSCVLDYEPCASQWEAAAAAEWLTVLVDLLKEEELRSEGVAVPATTAQHRLPTPAKLLNEYFHFDDSPMARKLLITVKVAKKSGSMGSAYAASALLQLAVHLHAYVHMRHGRHRRPRQAPSTSPPPEGSIAGETAAVSMSVVYPLCPTGAPSLAHWVTLLQEITSDNRRLTHICAAFDSEWGDNHSSLGPVGEKQGSGSTDTTTTHSRIVVKDAWARALTAGEQIALQYCFAGSLFAALEALLPHSPVEDLYRMSISSSFVYDAVAATVLLPTPNDVTSLLRRRFHGAGIPTNSYRDGRSNSAWTSSLSPPPALLFGYQFAMQWACCLGSRWLSGALAGSSLGHQEPSASSNASLLLQDANPFSRGGALLEDLCAGTLKIMQGASPGISQRTRCAGAMLLAAVVDMCPVEQRSTLEGHGAALFAASVTLRRLPCVCGMQARLLRCVRSAAEGATATNWVDENLSSLGHVMERLKEAAPMPTRQGDRRSSPRRSRSSARPSVSPLPHDAARAARDFQSFQILVSLLTSLVSCVGVESEVYAAAGALASQSRQGGDDIVPYRPLLDADQRRRLCTFLCDALSVEKLQNTVVLALRSMAETVEGQNCIMTDISASGDPLGRTLFGRLLARTLRLPSRWVGRERAEARGPQGSTPSPQGHRHRSTSAPPAHHSPNRRNPTASSPQSVRHAGSVAGAYPIDNDTVCVVGCEVLTRLLGLPTRESPGGTEGRASTAANAGYPPTQSSFLAAFVRHRGLEHLFHLVLESDRQLRRHGRALAVVPLHWLQLVAAVSFHLSVAKAMVQDTEVFSVLLELAGTPAVSSSSATASTFALLAIRNVCFSASVKSLLCQDVRVLLTLKAASMGLASVSQLIEWRPPHSSRISGRPSSAATGLAEMNGFGDSPQTRRGVTAVGVSLREDVIDMENKAEVDWAKQVCVHSRNSQLTDAAPVGIPQQHSMSPEATPVRTKGLKDSTKTLVPGTPRHEATPGARKVFTDITNQPTSAVGASEESVLAAELNLDHVPEKGEEAMPALVLATDTERGRRQYLAATAFSVLWFDHQRGRASIARVLGMTPSLKMEEVQAIAQHK